jgi:hypothetical protein
MLNRHRLGLAVLAGGLAFVGSADATELVIDGSFENVEASSNPVVKVGGKPSPATGEGWSTFSTYLYSTQYTMPGPAGSGTGFLRPYPTGTYGITRSSTNVFQQVSLTSGTTLTPTKIDAGNGRFQMSAWFSSYLSQGDFSDLTLEFLDDTGQVVGEAIPLGGSEFIVSIPTAANPKYGDAKEWSRDSKDGTIPSGARLARVTIQSTSVGGAPDGYVDVVSLDVSDAALVNPAVIAADPQNGAVGVGPVVNLSVTLQDRTTAVDSATIRLFLDDTPVSPTVEKVDANTTVKYPAGVLPPLSSHTYRIVFGDTSNPPRMQTNEFRFTTANFLTLPDSLRGAPGSEDASQPGFEVRVYQVAPVEPGDPAPTQINIPSSIAFLESVLEGLLGPNTADLTGATAGNSFAVPEVVNWASAGGAPANFPDDHPFPGIPGTAGLETGFVHELLTYLSFPAAGYYQMGINSEDAFRLTAATSGVATLRITAPTSVTIPCVPIATNITQLQFGGSLPSTPLTGTVVYATPSGNPEDACSLADHTGLAGKIVLLDRGTSSCDSAAKAEQAQRAGAIAVLMTTPEDTGFPFRLGDINAAVHIPVLVLADNFGASQLKQLLSQPQPVQVTLQTDTNLRLAEWDGPKGFGAVDVTFGFAVPAPGVYPFRLVAGQEAGNANLEWFTIKADGTRLLLNETSNPDAVRAFRARKPGAGRFNPPALSANGVAISWTGAGTLEEASSVLGPWTTSPSQANPQSVPASSLVRVYRLRQ